MYGCLDGREGDIMMPSNGMSYGSITRDGYSRGCILLVREKDVYFVKVSEAFRRRTYR